MLGEKTLDKMQSIHSVLYTSLRHRRFRTKFFAFSLLFSRTATRTAPPTQKISPWHFPIKQPAVPSQPSLTWARQTHLNCLSWLLFFFSTRRGEDPSRQHDFFSFWIYRQQLIYSRRRRGVPSLCLILTMCWERRELITHVIPCEMYKRNRALYFQIYWHIEAVFVDGSFLSNQD